MKEKRDPKLYILDMLQAIEEVYEFIADIPNADALVENKLIYSSLGRHKKELPRVKRDSFENSR